MTEAIHSNLSSLLHNTRYLRLLILFISSGLFAQTAPVADTSSHEKAIHIRHPLVLGDAAYAHRAEYFIKLLTLAMERSGVAFKLEAVPIEPVPASRNMHFLKQNKYDINWMHTTPKREAMTTPVFIPLAKGLVGWRIAFIRAADTDTFLNIRSISDLKALNAGQGHDWPDTPILQAHNFKLVTAVSRNSLIAMLERGRIDYFPRSITEIWDEVPMYQQFNIVVDRSTAFWYPTAYYYFVQKGNEDLARHIELGLNKAISDGSFNELFYRYFGEVINRARLHERQIFILNNPNMSDQTPLQRPELWYKPTIDNP